MTFTEMNGGDRLHKLIVRLINSRHVLDQYPFFAKVTLVNCANRTIFQTLKLINVDTVSYAKKNSSLTTS